MYRCYSDLIKLDSYLERYEYLKLGGGVGAETFGFDRYINQAFYRSRLWKQTRAKVIARDMGCDLAIEDRPIFDRVLVHHMNPIQETDLHVFDERIIDPEFLITVSHTTHNAIHYGSDKTLILPPEDRRPNDTIPWR